VTNGRTQDSYSPRPLEGHSVTAYSVHVSTVFLKPLASVASDSMTCAMLVLPC